MTADEKYSLLKRRNLLPHIPMDLPQKRKIIAHFFFFDFRKLRLNFEYFEKQDDPTNSCTFEVTDSGKRCLLNV